jgi:hypothetical protein
MSKIVQDTSGCRDIDSYDTSKYSFVAPDSNDQSTVTAAGEDHFTRYDVGGVGPETDSNITAGELSLG